MTDIQVTALRVLCERNGGYKGVADAIGANPQTIYQIISGIKLPSGRARGVGPVLREKLNQRFPGWLVTHTGNGFIGQGTPVGALDDEDQLSDEYIQIRETEVRFAAGNGRQAHFDEVSESVPRTYRRSWFMQEGINPEQARCFKVHGESMEPFLYDGDTVLVNLSEREIINGKVYAIRYGDELRIKRVYRKIDGGLVLHSDNPTFLPRDEDVPPAVVQEHIGIIGRVRDKSGTGGL